MLDTFTMAGAGDFRQRYRNSYGYFTVPSDNRKVLVFIQSVDDTVTFIDENRSKYYGHPDEGLEFEFIPVRKKLFMYGEDLFLAQRQPARQWARGVNQQNTRITNVSKHRGEDLLFGIVRAAFEAPSYDVLTNVKLLEERVLTSITLSDMFGVVKDVLYLYDNPIGSFLTGPKEITLEESLFKQEVMDLVERNNLGYRVGVDLG